MTKKFFKEKCPESKKYENNLKHLYKLANNCSKISYIIMDEEYDKKWNELLDINLRIDIPVSACKSTYSYSADAFRINVDFYKRITLNEKKVRFSYNNPVDRLSILFYFKDENISMYTQLKKTGRWIPLSAKTLAYYKNKYPKCTYIDEILSCIEDIFLSKKRYFIKDVLKYIKEGNFIPHLNMNDICNYTSFNHAFRDKYPMNKNWNKNDINVLYITYKLKKYVTNKNILYNIIRDYYNTDKTGLNNLTLKYINARKKVLKKLYCFYINDNFMNDYFQFEYGGYIDDYIELCFKENEKIKFKKSIKKIVEEHDKIVEKALKNKRRGKKKVIVKNNSKFNDLRKLLPDEFEWLKDSKRLELETYMQHNCVYTYDTKVKQDKCAIYSWLCKDENERYTIEFAKRKGKYVVCQMQKRFNNGHSESAMQYVNSFLNAS